MENPFLAAMKKKIKVQEIGSETELGSWKMVLDRHGPNVAFEALRQGTLAYVPHNLLREGHRVKWPESHEFVMDRRFWKTNWRDEISFETDDEHAETQSAIEEWMKQNVPEGDVSRTLQSYEDLMKGANTGIPDDVTMNEPNSDVSYTGQADTAIKSEADRAVHPQHYGK